MNINVRVISAAARAQIKALQQQVAMLEGELAKASAIGGSSSAFGSARSRKSLAAWGNQIQWTGRQLTYNWTIPLGIAGVAATKFALDNEKAFTHIKKVYGDATDAAAQFNKEVGKSPDALYGQQKAAAVFNNELQALEKSFVALSNRYGVAQKDVLETASAWAAAGSSGVALAKSTELSIRTAVLGDMDLAKATQALISIQAQYGESTKDLGLTLAYLNAIENQTGISMQGLIDGFARTAGVARESGIDVRHLGAMLAALVPATGSAATAGNALKTIISRIMAPTKDAADVMKEFGVDTSTAFWQSNTAMDRLMILAGHMNSTLHKAADGGYELSDSQKQVVASVLGSRYQMNRFLVLMRELGPEYSYYEKALNATSDRSKAFQQATAEMNAVLNSSPQRLKIIWTTLQNGMATAIQPLIPYVIYLAQQIASLVDHFAKLDPNIQKVVLTFLVLLATIGPITKYFGSLMTLIGVMGMPIKALIGAWVSLMTVQTEVNGVMVMTRLTLLGLFETMLKAPFVFMYRGFIALGGAIKSFAVAWVFLSRMAMVSGRALVVIWTSTWVSLKAVWVSGMTSLRILSAGWAIWEVGLFTKLRAGLVVISTMTWRSLLVIYRGGMAALMVLLGTGFTKIGLLVLRFGKFLVSPWGLAVLAILAIFAMFHDQLVKIWNNTISYFTDSNSEMVQLIVRAWNALPSAITNVLVAVARVVQQAALAIYHWFSYINPFVHHSPSLVENVTKGTAIISQRFAAMSRSVSGDIKGAYREIAAFKNATKSLLGRSNSFEEAQQRAKIKKFAPGALGQFDAMSARLKVLQRDLDAYQKKEDAQQAVVNRWQVAVDAMNKKLDTQQKKLEALQAIQDKWSNKLQAAQDRLDKFANAPIKGMKRMSDQIFANDMAQKRLQLDMMKMEDAVGPLDQIKSKLDEINGAQEMLRGDQAALRSAGAGSNILGFYDDQIKALESQKNAQTGAAQALQDMNDQLDELQRKGQMLDLENSLKFDPLTRQIEDAANAMKELPFDVIMAGVRGAQADISKYQDRLDSATAAVDRQQNAVDRLTKQRDALQARLDRENDTLDKIKNRYDAINQAIQDMQQAMSDAAAAADTLQQKQDALKKNKKKAGSAGYISPAVQNFRDAAKGNFPIGGGDGIPIRTDWSDQTDKINKFTQHISNQAAKAFDNLNPFEAIKRKWPEFKSWFGKKWSDLSSATGDMLSHMFEGTGFGDSQKAMDKFRIGWAKTVDWFNDHIMKNLKKVWKLIWPSIHEFLVNMMHGFHELWKQVSPELKKWGPLFKDLGGALKGMWMIARPILKILAGEFLLLAKIILSMAAKAIYPLLQLIGNVLENVLQMIRGVLQIVIGFLTIFSGDWRKGLALMRDGVLNLVNGLFGALGQLIKGAGKLILALIWGLVKGIFDFFKWLFEKMIGHSLIPDLINGIFKWFKKLAELPKWVWDKVLKPVYDYFKDLWNKYVKPALAAWWAGIKMEWNALKSLALWVWNNILKPVWNWIHDLWSKYVRPALSDWWTGIKAEWNALTNLGDWFKQHVMDPVFNAVKSGWEHVRDWLRDSKDMLTGPMKSIANGIIGGVDAVINGLNKISDVLPGPINWHISPIQKLATGGQMRQGNRGFKTNGARAIVGEGKANYPEFVIPTDPTYRNRAKSLMALALSKMGYKNGASLQGVLGDSPKDIANVARGHVKDAYRAIPAYGIGGWISSNFHKATGWFEGKAKDLISKAVNPLLDKAESTVRGVGWNAIEPPPLYGIARMRDWINDVNSQYNTANTAAQDRLSGGPKARRALRFARSQVGDPYIWGGVGPNGFDCSGFQSAITNVLRGRSPYSRVGTTSSFPWAGFKSGTSPQAKGYTIGSTKSYAGGVGHMAGTLAGVNVESRGGTGVIVGPRARGYLDPGFNQHAYLPLKEGGIALANRGPLLAAMGDGRYDEAVVPLPKGFRDSLIGGAGGETVININGDLSFPNIKSGADAKTFIDNLESLAKD